MNLFQARLGKIKASNIQVGEGCMKNMEDEDEDEKDVLSFDTGGGWNGTTPKIAWLVFKYTNRQQ